MKEILAGGGLLAFLALIVLVLATILQPIFVWMICARIKRTNQLLERLTNNHRALK